MMSDEEFVKLAVSHGIREGAAWIILQELELLGYCIAHADEIDGG